MLVQIHDDADDPHNVQTEELVRAMLMAVGEDPDREGLLETPRRVVEAWDEWFSGYNADTDAEILKVFKDGAENCGDELVIVGSIDFYSHCEHHMAPFFGKAWVGYIPDGQIVGLSKFARIVDKYARRLQVQERIGNQVADAIAGAVQPKGVAVLLRCQHMCMCSRGVNKQGSMTTTSALRGVLRESDSARAEFMSLVALDR